MLTQELGRIFNGRNNGHDRPFLTLRSVVDSHFFLTLRRMVDNTFSNADQENGRCVIIGDPFSNAQELGRCVIVDNPFFKRSGAWSMCHC